MKKNIVYSLLTCCLIVFLFISFSCKKGLDDRQKLFLEYAKLEDIYSNSGFYRNLDLYNFNIDPIVYNDINFNFNSFKKFIIENFKIYIENNKITYDTGLLDIQFPHQYIMIPKDDGSINTKLTVFIPETYYKFSISKDDIGKVIENDSIEITLLDMTNDGATLLVEDKATRQNYDYTYPIGERKKEKKKEKYILPNNPGYGKYLFQKERIEKPNSSNVTVKDSLSRYGFSRLNISVSDESQKVLLSEGHINDFRHYLWYRNNDMPYPELLYNYMDIRSRYIELDQDTLHNFNPINIVTIKASGKINQVDFFLRSRKGRIETIDLGNIKPQDKTYEPRTVATTYAPILTIGKENIDKLLKLNYIKTSVLQNEPDYIALYASIPHGFNNQRMSIYFNDIKLINSKNDTIDVNKISKSDNLFSSFAGERNTDNLRSVKFSQQNTSPIKIIGEIEFSITNYQDKKYTIDKLPKGLVMDADGVSLKIDKQTFYEKNVIEIYAFAKGDAANALAMFSLSDLDYSNPIMIHKYVKKPSEIIIRYKAEDFEKRIPFELTIKNDKLN